MVGFMMRRPDDWHVHMRQGRILEIVAPLTARYFARALVMPNTNPPILTGTDAERYRSEIAAVSDRAFEPLLTIKVTPDTTPEMVRLAKSASVVAGKLYPEGVTTGADVGGVRDFRALWPVFEAMQDIGMVLCLHGELPEASVLQREHAFLPMLVEIAESFPDLRVVLEHVSTAAGVDAVRALRNVAATITAHHLVLTIDDVIADSGLHVHHFCKPLAKTARDRDAIVKAATSGDSQFFFGSDSAPHSRDQKESGRAPAGVFSAPVAISVLAQVFDDAGALDHLEKFASVNGAQFYGLPLNEGSIELLASPWVVPSSYEDLVPFRAGERLGWRVLDQRM